jgi:hypothetical protein
LAHALGFCFVLLGIAVALTTGVSLLRSLLSLARIFLVLRVRAVKALDGAATPLSSAHHAQYLEPHTALTYLPNLVRANSLLSLLRRFDAGRTW